MENRIPFRKLPEYKAQSQEVVRVINGYPHLLVRIVIKGDHFPFRSVDPLIRISTKKEKYLCNIFAEIAPDNSYISGYFPVNMYDGVIEFGYEDELWGTIPGDFNTESVTRLDRKKLPKDIIIVNDMYSIKQTR